MTSYNAPQAAASAGIDTIVLASSINAIGGAYPAVDPAMTGSRWTEQHPTYSEDPYSLSKWVAEVQAQAFVRRVPEMSVVALRSARHPRRGAGADADAARRRRARSAAARTSGATRRELDGRPCRARTP